MKKCPVCGKEYDTQSVISMKDSTKEICLRCGYIELLRASTLSSYTKKEMLRIYDGK